MADSTRDHAVDLEKADHHIHDNHWDYAPSGGPGLRNHHLRNLHIFQDLVGIRTHGHILRPGLSTDENRKLRANTLEAEGGTSAKGEHLDDMQFDRPKRKGWRKLIYNASPGNEGYYRRAMNEQQAAGYWFTVSSICINMIYIIQILTAATITGLASYQGHRVGLTVLGATNTILAGLMAYIKGQGLPTRLQRSRDQFTKVLEYAEYKERQFSHYATMLPKLKDVMDPYAEADRVRDLFVAAKKDQQENYPDTYLNNNERQTMTRMKAKDGAGFTEEELQSLVKEGDRLKGMRD